MCQSLCLTSSHRVFARFIHAVPRIRSFSLSDNVSLYSYTSFIHASVDASLADIHTQVFVWAYVFISLGCIPNSGIPGSCDDSIFTTCDNPVLTIWETARSFSSGTRLYHFTCLPSVCEGFSSTHPCQHLLFAFDYSHPSGYISLLLWFAIPPWQIMLHVISFAYCLLVYVSR